MSSSKIVGAALLLLLGCRDVLGVHTATLDMDAGLHGKRDAKVASDGEADVDAGSRGAACDGGELGCESETEPTQAMMRDPSIDLGQPCDLQDALGCDGAAQRKRLRCDDDQWIDADDCASDERCDSSPGRNLGTCQPLLPECADREPGARVCVGADVRTCGPDLIDAALLTACKGELPACLDGDCVQCHDPKKARLCADASTPRSCNKKGAWVNAAPCERSLPNCLDGSCVELCTSGERRCSDRVPQACVDQAWQNGTECADDTPACAEGKCVECHDPSPDMLCRGLAPRTCADNQWSEEEPCSGDHATSTCSEGDCKVVSCSAGFGDCDGMGRNGCETDLTTADDCGACRRRCKYGLCADATCAVSYYGFGQVTAGAGDVSAPAGAVVGVNVYVTEATTLVAIGSRVVNSGVHVRLGLYGDDDSPTSLVAQTDELTSGDTTEGRVPDTALAAGSYWIVGLADGVIHYAAESTLLPWCVALGFGYGPLPSTAPAVTKMSVGVGDFYIVTTP